MSSSSGPTGQTGQPGQSVQQSQPGGGINFLPSTDAIRKVLTSQVTPNAIHWFGMSFVIVVILWLITYVTTKINLGKTNCDIIKEVNKKITPTKITSEWTTSTSPDYVGKNLRDFYIKTAYNCCASGQFKSDYVDICALRNAIKQGVRCLDFEIFCVENRPVVGVSSIDVIGVKQSYNSIPISVVLKEINESAFSETAGICPNPKDPLLLHFRIRTNNVNILNILASEIAENLGDKLLPIDFMKECNGSNLTAKPIKAFLGKVVIMVEKNNTSNSMPLLYQSKNLWELTNVTTNSVFIHEKRFMDVKNSNDLETITNFNKKNMTIVLPDLSVSNANYITTVPQALGCQLMAMNFQNYDQNLITYNELFETKQSAFIPKPSQLLYVPVTTTIPDPLNPELSYAPRTSNPIGGVIVTL
jgi:hypothetical protein